MGYLAHLGRVSQERPFLHVFEEATLVEIALDLRDMNDPLPLGFKVLLRITMSIVLDRFYVIVRNRNMLSGGLGTVLELLNIRRLQDGEGLRCLGFARAQFVQELHNLGCFRGVAGFLLRLLLNSRG